MGQPLKPVHPTLTLTPNPIQGIASLKRQLLYPNPNPNP